MCQKDRNETKESCAEVFPIEEQSGQAHFSSPTPPLTHEGLGVYTPFRSVLNTL